MNLQPPVFFYFRPFVSTGWCFFFRFFFVITRTTRQPSQDACTVVVDVVVDVLPLTRVCLFVCRCCCSFVVVVFWTSLLLLSRYTCSLLLKPPLPSPTHPRQTTDKRVTTAKATKIQPSPKQKPLSKESCPVLISRKRRISIHLVWEDCGNPTDSVFPHHVNPSVWIRFKTTHVNRSGFFQFETSRTDQQQPPSYMSHPHPRFCVHISSKFPTFFLTTRLTPSSHHTLYVFLVYLPPFPPSILFSFLVLLFRCRLAGIE